MAVIMALRFSLLCSLSLQGQSIMMSKSDKTDENAMSLAQSKDKVTPVSPWGLMRDSMPAESAAAMSFTTDMLANMTNPAFEAVDKAVQWKPPAMSFPDLSQWLPSSMGATPEKASDTQEATEKASSLAQTGVKLLPGAVSPLNVWWDSMTANTPEAAQEGLLAGSNAMADATNPFFEAADKAESIWKNRPEPAFPDVSKLSLPDITKWMPNTKAEDPIAETLQAAAKPESLLQAKDLNKRTSLMDELRQA